MGRGVRNTFSYAQVSATLKTAKRKKTDDVLGLDQWKDAMTTKPQGGCPKCDHKIAAFMQIQVSLPSLSSALFRRIFVFLVAAMSDSAASTNATKKKTSPETHAMINTSALNSVCCCHFGPLLVLAVFGAVRL